MFAMTSGPPLSRVIRALRRYLIAKQRARVARQQFRRLTRSR